MGTAVPFWTCIWTLTLAYVGACGYSVVMASLDPLSLGPLTALSSAAASATMPASLSVGAAALPLKVRPCIPTFNPQIP